MSGRYSLTDLLGRCYWRTDDLRDAYATARDIGRAVDLLVVRDDETGRTVYVKNGRVSVYVTRDGEDVDRVRRSRVA